MEKESWGKVWDMAQGQHTWLGHRQSHGHLDHVVPAGSFAGLRSFAAGRAGHAQSYGKTQQGPDPKHGQETFLPRELHDVVEFNRTRSEERAQLFLLATAPCLVIGFSLEIYGN